MSVGKLLCNKIKKSEGTIREGNEEVSEKRIVQKRIEASWGEKKKRVDVGRDGTDGKERTVEARPGEARAGKGG